MTAHQFALGFMYLGAGVVVATGAFIWFSIRQQRASQRKHLASLEEFAHDRR